MEGAVVETGKEGEIAAHLFHLVGNKTAEGMLALLIAAAAFSLAYPVSLLPNLAQIALE